MGLFNVSTRASFSYSGEFRKIIEHTNRFVFNFMRCDFLDSFDGYRIPNFLIKIHDKPTDCLFSCTYLHSE